MCSRPITRRRGPLLDRILLITNSEYGFLGEVLHDEAGAPYLKTYALTNLAWDDATLALFREEAAKGGGFNVVMSRSGKTIFVPEGTWAANGYGEYRGHQAICDFFEALSNSVVNVLHYVSAPHITIAAEELTKVGPVKLTNTMITSWFVVSSISRTRATSKAALCSISLTGNFHHSS